jgi:phage terminase large subunit-like protein
MDITRSALTRIVVAIDPAVSSNEDSDDTGIIVAARGPHIDIPGKPCALAHCPGHGFVLDDRTCHVAPHEWARIAVAAYDDWQADRIVAEVNNGGEMVGETIHAIRAGIPYSKVTATRGKRVRAEPVAALSEQNRIHFVGEFPDLEHQLNTWDPELSKESPDRLDAFVWAMTYLGLIGGQGAAFMQAWKEQLSAGRLYVPPAEVAVEEEREEVAPCSRPDCAWRACSEDAALEECANCDLYREKEGAAR